MGSIDSTIKRAVKLPTVKLDTTLAELYRRANPQSANKRVGWISSGITSAVDITPNFPRNTKYVYQDQALITATSRELRSNNVGLQRSLATKYLGLIPQRDAFISGATPVIFFDQGQTPEQMERERREAEATLSVLDPSQRPELAFCSGPTALPDKIKEHAIDQLEYKTVLDGLQGLPVTHDLDTHWFLNSKAALARSGLPTPATEVIEVEGYPAEPDSCCTVCRADHDTSNIPIIPPGCAGPRGQWLEAQTTRILSAIRARPVPFVLKAQQAFGGAGTWLVETEAEKDSLLADLTGTTDTNTSTPNLTENSLLRKLLALPNAHNTHLHPAALLLTDLITSPTADYGLTFIATTSPTPPIFLAASEQIIAHSDDSSTSSHNGSWIGSTIHYPSQPSLLTKFTPLITHLSRWITAHGYVGPVGADILQSRETGEWQVVDLNVRTSGSVSLALLRGHFFEGRGLAWASSISVRVKETREGFLERWRGEVEEGRVVVLGWCEEDGGSCIADVVVGAEDGEGLKGLVRRVREGTEEVTF